MKAASPTAATERSGSSLRGSSRKSAGARKAIKRTRRLPASSRPRWRQNEPGLSATPHDEPTIDPMAERTRPVAVGDTSPAPQAGEANLRAINPVCETGRNGEPCSTRMGNVAKRTRQCSAASHKTNLRAPKTVAVRAELSSRCNRAEAKITIRIRAIPTSQWKVVRTLERIGARIHSLQNERRAYSSCHGRYMRAVLPSIAPGYRSRAPGSNRVFRPLH